MRKAEMLTYQVVIYVFCSGNLSMLTCLQLHQLFEYMEITITSRNQMPLRLYVLYRPQRFKNKKPTAPIFFHEFSSFLEEIELFLVIF